jgi:hypothetical protein
MRVPRLSRRGAWAQRVFAGLWLCLWPTAVASAQAPLQVRHPALESTDDARQGYPRAVLQLALQHAGQPYVLRAATIPANQQRALRMLATGNDLDVVWTVATDQRERGLRSIPFAIDRGLYGWRVLMIRRGDEKRFDGLRDSAGLAGLRGGQGADWPDLEILRAAGLQVAGVPTYDGLFAMLARGRIDYVPRSVLEIGDELARRPRHGFAVEPRILLRYPSALRFYVGRNNDTLARALAAGLARAEADGCLDRLFHATYDDVLAPLRLDSRIVLALGNPVWTAPRRNPP